MPPLLTQQQIAVPPEIWLREAGEIFAAFDFAMQDSGNVSYGVQSAEGRFFVKTAGDPNDARPFLPHADRVLLLRNAVRLHSGFSHPLLPPLRRVIESPHGPLLVFDWCAGELLGVSREQRENPDSAFQRFRALLPEVILRHLDALFALHVALTKAGWIASDFYDGCLLYDFSTDTLHILDLDTYHFGPFVNTMGRMFGSTRFMAPEEFTKGATIDERTTVFTLARTALIFLADGTPNPEAFRGNPALLPVLERACNLIPEARFPTVGAFYTDWQQGRQQN